MKQLAFSSSCPLCDGSKIALYFVETRREYWQCLNCALVFVPFRFHLDEKAELALYKLHQNSPLDEGYARFLNRLAQPLLERLKGHLTGLDFGCGPGPTLSGLLQQAGHHVQLYDKFFATDSAVLQQFYDFITATEVVEHLPKPGMVLNALWRQLNNCGWLAIMTKLVEGPEAFARWHYKNDPTHIVFFSRDTFIFLAEKWQAKIEFIARDIIFLQKNNDQLG